jgi:hypothetical protein
MKAGVPFIPGGRPRRKHNLSRFLAEEIPIHTAFAADPLPKRERIVRLAAIVIILFLKICRYSQGAAGKPKWRIGYRMTGCHPANIERRRRLLRANNGQAIFLRNFFAFVRKQTEIVR